MYVRADALAVVEKLAEGLNAYLAGVKGVLARRDDVHVERDAFLEMVTPAAELHARLVERLADARNRERDWRSFLGSHPEL